MGQVTFVEHDGTGHEVEIRPGRSLMRHAVDNLVPGTYYMDAWKDQNNNGQIDAGDLFGVYGNFSASGTNLTPIPVAAGQPANVSFTITTFGNPTLTEKRVPVRIEVE